MLLPMQYDRQKSVIFVSGKLSEKGAGRVHPFSTYAKFSEKLTRTCEYQGVRNVGFSENIPYVLNGWARTGTEQFGFGYGHKVMMEVGIYFKKEIQSNILLWPKKLGSNIPLQILAYLYL